MSPCCEQGKFYLKCNLYLLFAVLIYRAEGCHSFTDIAKPKLPSRRMCISERESLCIACEQLAMFITENLCMAA